MAQDMMTFQETRQWAMLRAIEWAEWPIFVAQPLVPLLLLWISWWKIVIGLWVVDLLWNTFNEKWVNVSLADFGCYFVKLKWLSSVGMAIYFYANDMLLYAVVSLLWPLITLVLMLLVPSRTMIGRVESLFLQKIGVYPDPFD